MSKHQQPILSTGEGLDTPNWSAIVQWDSAVSQHTTPCGECPFRRQAWPGYFGSNEPENFSLLSMSDARMPCHPTVDYEDQDWEVLQEDSPECAGRAIMMANMAKRPRDRDRMVLEQDKVKVFSTITEFNEWHGIRPYVEIFVESLNKITRE